MRKLLIPVFLLLITPSVYAQDITVKGYFMSDSIKIGEPAPYVLTALYSRKKQVLFPDSTYDFSPYELYRKEYFPTSTKDTLLFDSAVYHILSFEIDPLQRFSLPVYLIQGRDSITFQSSIDSVFLIELIPETYDTLKLIENTSLIELPVLFNYPYFLIGAGTLIVLVVLILVIFGKTIRRKIKLYRLKKKHLRFLDEFNTYIREVREKDEKEVIEQGFFFWKKYMEGLDQKPYTKLTTREIKETTGDESVYKSSREIDRAIYGGFKGESLHRHFEDLEDYSNKTYQRRIAEIRNG